MPSLYGETGNGVREILLTFDDGPSPATTPRLLDTLAANDIHAVFFVLGQLIKGQGKAIVERAHSEGHVIGNHTFTHPNLKTLGREQIKDELRRTHDLICEITGECKLFRPPYGAYNSVVGEALQELGYEQLLWSVDTLDWKYRSTGWVDVGMEQIKVREDCVVLMHDIHATTVDNVPNLISRIKRTANSTFVPYQ